MTYPAPENPDTDYSLRSDLIDLTERALAIHFLFTREAAQRLVAHRRTHGRQRRHDQRELTP